MSKRFAFPLAALAVTLAAPAALAQQTAAEAQKLANEQITAAQLKTYLSYVASDEMEGRDTPSRGLDLTAKFLATMLERWGVKPMGDDGTFYQKIRLERRRVDPERTKATLAGAALRLREDFLASTAGGGGSAEGQLVYVGPGYVLKSKNINPYAGLDVKGKILVVAQGGLPRGTTFRDFPPAQRGKDWWSPEQYGAENGAVGVVYLPRAADADAWRGFVNGSERFGGGYRMARAGGEARPAPARPGGSLPTITLAPDAATRLFAGEAAEASALRGQNAVAPFALKAEKTLAFTTAVTTEVATTQNVVAVVEGSDPSLRSEYIAVGAHYDHVGVGRPDQNGDAIYNGADDDGSGTVALLAMAEALSRSATKPKRSILFVWHCGEEKGLWGSDYFTDKPTVPLKQIAAQVNIDMIGRSKTAQDSPRTAAQLSGPDGVFVIGATKMSTQLGALAERENKGYLNLAYDYKFDDPKDPEGLFYRSDHFNYARKGIPILFFFDGIHADYHRPSDEVSKIDFPKYEKVARTVFVTACGIANLPQRPVVDKPLSAAETRGE